jgi:predicted dinucleotide-binding enzyme
MPLRTAIMGAGSIGAALAAHLILAGNNVTIGARRPNGFDPPDYQREDIDYPVCTIEEAIDGAEVAILAIPNAAPPGRVPDAAVWHSRQPASDAGDKRITDRPRKVFR